MARGLQVAKVADVEQIEAAVGEHDVSPRVLPVDAIWRATASRITTRGAFGETGTGEAIRRARPGGCTFIYHVRIPKSDHGDASGSNSRRSCSNFDAERMPGRAGNPAERLYSTVVSRMIPVSCQSNPALV